MKNERGAEDMQIYIYIKGLEIQIIPRPKTLESLLFGRAGGI